MLRLTAALMVTVFVCVQANAGERPFTIEPTTGIAYSDEIVAVSVTDEILRGQSWVGHWLDIQSRSPWDSTTGPMWIEFSESGGVIVLGPADGEQGEPTEWPLENVRHEADRLFVEFGGVSHEFALVQEGKTDALLWLVSVRQKDVLGFTEVQFTVSDED